jgi:hypothetical protein
MQQGSQKTSTTYKENTKHATKSNTPRITTKTACTNLRNIILYFKVAVLIQSYITQARYLPYTYLLNGSVEYMVVTALYIFLCLRAT